MGCNIIHNFSDSLRIGEQGEKEFIEMFSQLPSVKKVIDLRNNKKMQEKDIDFLIKTETGNYTLELKTDTYTSGNFFIETMSAKEIHSLGARNPSSILGAPTKGY